MRENVIKNKKTPGDEPDPMPGVSPINTLELEILDSLALSREKLGMVLTVKAFFNGEICGTYDTNDPLC